MKSSLVTAPASRALLAFSISVAFSNMAFATSTLEQIEASFSGPGFAPALTAVAVLDASSGEKLVELNARKSAIPASCMKTLSSATALHFLGPGHRFKTALSCSGNVDASGRLEGDLVIVGGGDPTLGSDRVKGSASTKDVLDRWAQAVQAAGIREVTGSVRADDSYFDWDTVPGSWCWTDIGNYYAAGTSGLCFNDNLYFLYFQPGKNVGDLAAIVKTDPPTPEIVWHNHMKTGPAGSGDQGYIRGGPMSLERWPTGTIPLGPVFSIKGSLPDPAFTAARMLRDRLTSEGIAVCGKPLTGASNNAGTSETLRQLLVIESPPLSAIVHTLNKISFNLYAEMMLLHAGKAAGASSREEAIEVEKKYLKELGVDLAGFNISDGSGLGREDTVTALGMAQFMFGVQRESYFKPWYDSLPVLGVDGDVKKREANSPIKGRVHAKTGLIGGVRGLSGYLDAKSGRKLCFALFSNHHTIPSSQVDRTFDGILLTLYEAY